MTDKVIKHIAKDRFVQLGGSSCGYAKKAELDGFWYKVSAGAFNAQAEVVAARLAKYTNLGAFIDYEMCLVNDEYATRSKDFIGGRPWETVKSLHIKRYGTPIEGVMQTVQGIELFDYVHRLVYDAIGIDLKESRLLKKLSLLLQFDAVVLNEDRHFGNILFIQDNGKWDFAPAFDFDCSFFSCVEDLRTIHMYSSPSLPYCQTHKEQLTMLYGLSNDRLTSKPFEVEDLVYGVWEDKHQIGKKEVTDYLNVVLRELSK